MDGIKGLLDWSQPQVTAAIIGAAVTLGLGALALLVNAILALILQWWKVRADNALSNRKFEFDKELAERRLTADRALAEHKSALDADLSERKFRYDRDLHDHKRRVELAESVLSDFYKIADVVRAIRSPFSNKSEAVGRKRAEHEAEDVAQSKDTYFVPLARIKENSQFISDLMSKKYRSKANLGNEIEQSFNKIHEVFVRIQVASQTLSSMAERGRVAFEGNELLRRKCEADIWFVSSEEDELQPMINDAIAIAERLCRPIIEGAYTNSEGV